MPNVHSVLNLAETNNIHARYWKAQKRDWNATLHLCLFLNTFAGYAKYTWKKSYEHTLPNIWTFPNFCM